MHTLRCYIAECNSSFLGPYVGCVLLARACLYYVRLFNTLRMCAACSDVHVVWLDFVVCVCVENTHFTLLVCLHVLVHVCALRCVKLLCTVVKEPRYSVKMFAFVCIFPYVSYLNLRYG